MQTAIRVLPMVLNRQSPLPNLLLRLARPVPLVQVALLPQLPELLISHLALVFAEDRLEMIAIASP